MKVDRLFYGSWYANCYIVTAEDSNGNRHSAVVDPAYPAKDVIEHVSALGSTVDAIIMTHGHFDHIYYLDALRDATGATAYIHKNDAEMLADGEKNANRFFFGTDLCCREADVLLSDGDVIPLGDGELRVVYTPGHSKGSICILGDGFMITGDTLFANGYGRYDLYGADPRVLAQTLASFEQYDKSLVIYPGHGSGTTLGRALENIF